MRNRQFATYNEFRDEILRHRAGPFISPIEEMADEMFHSSHSEEIDSMWDSVDGDDD